jgi:hypothetical protein
VAANWHWQWRASQVINVMPVFAVCVYFIIPAVVLSGDNLSQRLSESTPTFPKAHPFGRESLLSFWYKLEPVLQVQLGIQAAATNSFTPALKHIYRGLGTGVLQPLCVVCAGQQHVSVCLSVTCDPWRQRAALHQLGHLRPTGR